MRVEWIGRCPQHAVQLAQWHHAEWRDLYPEWTLRQAADELCTHARRDTLPTTFVLLRGDELIGSVSLLLEDSPELHGFDGPWLASLYVRPEARSRGGGRLLVDAAVAQAACEGVEHLRLFTLWHEDYYAALGWETEQRASLHGTPVCIMGIDPLSSFRHTPESGDIAPRFAHT